MKKIENKILDWIIKNNFILFIIFFTILALFVRKNLLSFESSDYLEFLSPWFEQLKAEGGWKALANYPGDYNAPYMTILAFLTYLPINKLISIKLVSIIFDFIMAISAAYFVYTIVPNNKKWSAIISYIITLFLPQVIMNSSMWAQCDSIFTTFCLLSLTYLIKEKYIKSFICLGVAFAFKLQFVFILPIFIIIYLLERKFSIIYFLIIPITNFILCLPAISMGKPIGDLMMVYFNQTQTYSNYLTLNFINIFQIFKGPANYLSQFALLFTLCICVVVVFYLINKNIKLNNEKKVTLILWFIIIITFFLPHIHERYLYLGEVLSILYYICYRKNGIIVGIININAIITYSFTLFASSPIDYTLIAIVEFFIIGNFTKNTLKTLEEK